MEHFKSFCKYIMYITQLNRKKDTMLCSTCIVFIKTQGKNFFIHNEEDMEWHYFINDLQCAQTDLQV